MARYQRERIFDFEVMGIFVICYLNVKIVKKKSSEILSRIPRLALIRGFNETSSYLFRNLLQPWKHSKISDGWIKWMRFLNSKKSLIAELSKYERNERR